MYEGDGPRKRRLNPYKVLCLVIYGNYEFITWNGIDKVELRLGPLARLIQIQNYRLKDYLYWLQDFGYIEDLKYDYGKAWFRVIVPERWR